MTLWKKEEAISFYKHNCINYSRNQRIKKLPCRPWGTQMLRWRQSSEPKLEVWSALFWIHLLANLVALRTPVDGNNISYFFTVIKGEFKWDFLASVYATVFTDYNFKKCGQRVWTHHPSQGEVGVSQMFQAWQRREFLWKLPQSGKNQGGYFFLEHCHLRFVPRQARDTTYKSFHLQWHGWITEQATKRHNMTIQRHKITTKETKWPPTDTKWPQRDNKWLVNNTEILTFCKMVRQIWKHLFLSLNLLSP